MRNRSGERMSTHNLEVYRGHVSKHILNPEFGLGGSMLGHLTARVIDSWSNDLRDRGGVSVQTRKKILATLRVALQHCVRNDWIATNPARDVTVITPRGQESTQIVPPSKEDIRQLLATTKSDPDFYVRLLFSALSGARAGEQRALRWRDIDFEAANINIIATVDSFKAEQPTKTKAGERTVRMSDLLKRKMQEYRLRSLFSQDDDLVFPSATNRNEAASVAIGIPEDWKLRHRFSLGVDRPPSAILVFTPVEDQTPPEPIKGSLTRLRILTNDPVLLSGRSVISSQRRRRLDQICDLEAEIVRSRLLSEATTHEIFDRLA
jgi:integrase